MLAGNFDEVSVVQHVSHSGVAVAVAELVALLGKGALDRLVDVLLGEADLPARGQVGVGGRLAALV